MTSSIDCALGVPQGEAIVVTVVGLAFVLLVVVWSQCVQKVKKSGGEGEGQKTNGVAPSPPTTLDDPDM